MLVPQSLRSPHKGGVTESFVHVRRLIPGRLGFRAVCGSAGAAVGLGGGHGVSL